MNKGKKKAGAIDPGPPFRYPVGFYRRPNRLLAFCAHSASCHWTSRKNSTSSVPPSLSASSIYLEYNADLAADRSLLAEVLSGEVWAVGLAELPNFA